MKKQNSLVWLQRKRDYLKLTQAQVAEMAGVSRTTYASIEQGYRAPSVDTAMKIAEVVEVDWTIFFKNKLHELKNPEEVS